MKWSRIAIMIACLACIAIALKINKGQNGRFIHYPVPSTQGAKTIRMWAPHYVSIEKPDVFVDDGSDYQSIGINFDGLHQIVGTGLWYMPNKEGRSLKQCADYLREHRKYGLLLRDDQLPSKPGMQLMQEQTQFHEGLIAKTAYLYDMQTHCCYAFVVVADKEAKWGDIDRMQASLSLESVFR